jgi:deoxyribonuclease-4
MEKDEMIRIGQAGIPLSCKGRTNKDGIVYTHKSLDLNAIEIQFVRGLYVLSEEEALFIKDYAQKNDIEIHVHAPYYLNLAGDREELTMSFEKIIKSAEMANNIGSKTLIIHPGFYAEHSQKKTMKLITKN